MDEKEHFNMGITSGSSKTAMELVVQLGHEAAFGKSMRLQLYLIDLPCNAAALAIAAKELQLCGLMFIGDIKVRTTLDCFKDCDMLILLTPNPDTEDDNISAHVQYYKAQGLALSKLGKTNQVIVVHGDFANTHASLLLHFAPNIRPRQVTTVTSLAAIRGSSLLAAKLGVAVTQVHDVIVWGDSSPSGQFVDATYASVEETQDEDSGYFDMRDDIFKGGRRIGWDLDEYDEKKEIEPTFVLARKMLKNDKWLRDDFVKLTLGMHRPNSCAISQANAIVSHLKYIWDGTPCNRITSMGIAVTKADKYYGIPPGVFFSFPVTIENMQYTVIKDLYPRRVCMTEKFLEVAKGLRRELPLALATIAEQEREKLLLEAAKVVESKEGEIEVVEDSEAVKREKRIAAMCKMVMVGFRDEDSGPDDLRPELPRELVTEAWEMFVIQGVPVNIKKLRRGSGEGFVEEGNDEGVMEDSLMGSDEELIAVVEEDGVDEEGSLKELNGEVND